MKASEIIDPAVLEMPFALNGDKNNIPATNLPSTGDASQSLGFPPVTQVSVDAGGIPPARKDFNGLGYLTTSHSFYTQNGNFYTFSENVSSAIGGYPLGAKLWYTDSNNRVRLLKSAKDDNTDNFLTNPEFVGTSWIDCIPTQDYIDTNFINNDERTNCITGWNEDIKWVINTDRSLTVLAGSKFYVPNGPGNYEEIVLAENKSIRPWNGTLGYVNLYYDVASASIQGEAWGDTVSGETDSISNRYHLWFDTKNNIIKRYDGANQVIHAKCSFPLILINMPSATNFSSVWRTFNGFSICGSSYILLPGLKAIFADGYNDNGSVKNIEIETDHISVFTRTWNSAPGSNSLIFLSRSPQGATNLDPTIWWYNNYFVQGNEPMRGSENVDATYTIWYNPDTRKTYHWGGVGHEDWMEFPGCPLMIGSDTDNAGGMKISNIVRGYVTPFVAADASKVMGKEQFQVVTSLPVNPAHNTFYFCTNA